MRQKNALQIQYSKRVDQELKDLASEAEKLLLAKNIKIPPSNFEINKGAGILSGELNSGELPSVAALRSIPPALATIAKQSVALALATMALYPELISDEKQSAGIVRDFSRCYAKHPDATLQIIAALRQSAGERERKEREHEQKEQASPTQAGLARTFFLDTQYVVKKKGSFIEASELTIDDFQRDRETLKPGIKYVPVSELQDKDIAILLSKENFTVTPDSVKSVRQSLADSKGKD